MAEEKPAATRLGSLDALRGFVMFMLLGDGEIGHAGILSALFASIDQPWAQTICHQLRYSQWTRNGSSRSNLELSATGQPVGK